MAEQEAGLAPAARVATRDLILVLADSKRLLGTRYADWLLGAPELEAGIACASMAQDEWGHSRLLYALLKDFDEDVDALEHGREPADYCCIEALDRSPASWPELVALNALVDTALTVQLETLRESAYAPLKQRVAKPLDEEHFHFAHAQAWVRRMGRAGEEPRALMRQALVDVLPVVLLWFGESDAGLRAAGVVAEDPEALRIRFFQRIAPLLVETGFMEPDSAFGIGEGDFGDFDPARRRTVGTAPDADTIRRVRGDRNRAFLMD